MAKPEIKVKVGADTSELEKGLSSAQSRLSTFAKVGIASAVAAVGTLAAGMIGLTKASLSNIDALAKQARSLGLTTEAFQKMALVAGEAGVESGKLSALLGIMQRNVNELQKGTKLQTDAFAALGLSISDLQGLSPDEQFAKIADSLSRVDDATTKTALAMEVFGRGGREAINMLNGYSAASANAAEFQNRFGIAVSQSTSDNVERANDAVGRLGMVMEGLGNTMAGAVAPALESVANGLIAFAGGVIGAKVTLEEFFGTLDRAREALGEDFFNRLVGQPDKIVAMGPILEKIATEVQRLAIIAPGAAAGLERIEYHFEKMGQIGAADVMRQYKDELENASAAHEAGTITGEEYRAKVVSINDRVNDLIASFYSVDSVQFGALNAELSGLKTWIDSVASSARAMAEALPMGMDTGTGLTNTGDAFDLLPPGEGAVSTSPRPSRPSVDSYGNFVAAGQESGGGVGGVGGASQVVSEMAARLAALQEGFATEAEVVAEWYTESQATLAEALEAELLTRGEYATAIENLEQQHADKLATINDAAVKDRLAGYKGMFSDIASLANSGNKTLFKIGQAASLANALVSGYEAATDAWAKGMKIGGPPVAAAFTAASLVKTAGLISSIKSVNSSGGGGGSTGGGGGGVAATAAPAQQPATTFAFTLQNDPMGFGESFARQLIDQLNSTQRNGGQIRGVLA